MVKMREISSYTCLGTILYFGYAVPVSAQTATASNNDVAEIVVTAEKRSERLQNVPMSITAVTGEQLAERGIRSPTDLAQAVPGFTYQDSNNGVPVYAIRGIGFYGIGMGASPAVSVYVDQVPLPFSLEAQGAALDIERVEVLKGPQGTLFGQNSTGGAVNYIAAKPTDVLAAGGSVSYGNYNATTLQGFASGPLAPNLKARLAVDSEHADGWQKGYAPSIAPSTLLPLGVPAPAGTLGARDFNEGRLLVDWTPSQTVKFEFSATGWVDKSDTKALQYIGYAPTVPSPAGQPEQAAILPTYPVAPANNQAAEWLANKSYSKNDRFYQISLRSDWNISDLFNLTSITAYSQYLRYAPTSEDGTSFNDISVTDVGRLSSFSEELRASGTTGSGVKYTIGASFGSDKSREDELVQTDSSNSGIGPVRYHDVDIMNNQDVTTSAAFASLSVPLTSTVTAQGSVRYTDQHRKFNGCFRDTGDGELAGSFSFLSNIDPFLQPTTFEPGACVSFDETTGAPVGLIHSTLNQTNASWRIGLDWKADAHTLIYANITKGYKAGEFETLPAVYVQQETPVTQEAVLAYEVGFKTSFADRKIDIDGAVFYDDYANKQVQGYVPVPLFGTLPSLINVPKSSVAGAELNLVLRPVSALRVSLSGTYLKSKVINSTLAYDPLGTLTNIQDQQFPNTPTWSSIADIEYRIADIGSNWNGFIGGNVSYKGSSYAAFGNNSQFQINGYALLNLRAGVESKDGHWRAEVWGKNVTDKYYWVNTVHLIDTIARSAGMPATYGITIGYRM